MQGKVAAGGVVVIAHGAASTADFVHRVFDAPLAAAGYDVVSWDRRTPVQDADNEFAGLVRRTGATVVGGISAGAVLATRYALVAERLDGLLVALPPPPPGPPRLEQDVESVDIAAIVDDATRGAEPWVAAEVSAAWSTYSPDELRRELRTASMAAPPTWTDLAGCDVPTGIVALADDPLHPVGVAKRWAHALPRASLEIVQLHAPADDVAAIGAAVVRAWQQAVSGSR